MIAAKRAEIKAKLAQMQGATTDDEPMGRNPGTSEAANLTALKVRGCDSAPRFADLIEASGHVPRYKAVHMNASSARVKSIEKPLAPRAVPHRHGKDGLTLRIQTLRSMHMPK